MSNTEGANLSNKTSLTSDKKKSARRWIECWTERTTSDGTLHDISELEWRISEVDSPDNVYDSVVFYRNDADKYFFRNTIYFRLNNYYVLRVCHAAFVTN